MHFVVVAVACRAHQLSLQVQGCAVCGVRCVVCGNVYASVYVILSLHALRLVPTQMTILMDVKPISSTTFTMPLF